MFPTSPQGSGLAADSPAAFRSQCPKAPESSHDSRQTTHRQSIDRPI